MAETMTKPTIHSNGTSAKTLLEDSIMASAAVRAAIEALERAGPNARDYYPQGPDIFSIARMEHNRRIFKLTEVLKELEVMSEYLADYV